MILFSVFWVMKSWSHQVNFAINLWITLRTNNFEGLSWSGLLWKLLLFIKNGIKHMNYWIAIIKKTSTATYYTRQTILEMYKYRESCSIILITHSIKPMTYIIALDKCFRSILWYYYNLIYSVSAMIMYR